MQAIGFANKFYTLWSIRVDEQYYTAPNGNHYLSYTTTYYTYHKNISFDLEKAKALYPGLTVDENLRGKSSDWSEKTKDLTPEIIKGGKYAGFSLEEISQQDFQYILYMLDNSYTSFEVRNLIKELPLVKAHFEKLENDIQAGIQKRKDLINEFAQLGEITLNLERNLHCGYESDNAYITRYLDGEKIPVYLEFNKDQFSKLYYREFAYGLPLINGKAKRVKGKNCTIKFEKIEGRYYDYGDKIDNYFKVISFTINK
jgi:hypothetical protein